MIVVTGATGNIGRPLVDQLLVRGARVRALTRSPKRAGLPAAVETVRADFTSGKAMETALEGADALYLNLAGVGDPETAAQLVGAAAASGVRRIVMLSSYAVTDTAFDEENIILQMHAMVERAVRDSGLEWTLVRSGLLAANALPWAEPIRTTGVVRGPNASVAQALVHEADIAAVSAEALLDASGTHQGKVYRLTGPERLTPVQQVAVIGRAVGRELRYEELSREAVVDQMVGGGLPRVVAEAFVHWTEEGGERVSMVSPDVERVTGRPGRTFAEWVNDHLADFK
ncbi:NAD(P)H-binding protein [Streptomyces sioyaensis]|uniref:NAD(P)H-binding protein n=1 Tax=Streptomyces sioyaensis TaxID=67364 RepID=UPI0033D4648E